MSSRAEFRLLMRHDNADLRLTEIGHKIGLISEERYQNFLKKKENIQKALDILKATYLGKKKEIEDYFISLGFNELKGGVLALELLRRPNVTYQGIAQFIPALSEIELDESGIEEVEVIAKYEGYIEKQIRDANNFVKLEEMKIPASFNFLHMDGLALEARQKLDKVKPLTIGQASRISGVNPADVAILILNVRKYNHHE